MDTNSGQNEYKSIKNNTEKGQYYDYKSAKNAQNYHEMMENGQKSAVFNENHKNETLSGSGFGKVSEGVYNKPLSDLKNGKEISLYEYLKSVLYQLDVIGTSIEANAHNTRGRLGNIANIQSQQTTRLIGTDATACLIKELLIAQSSTLKANLEERDFKVQLHLINIYKALVDAEKSGIDNTNILAEKINVLSEIVQLQNQDSYQRITDSFIDLNAPILRVVDQQAQCIAQVARLTEYITSIESKMEKFTVLLDHIYRNGFDTLNNVTEKNRPLSSPPFPGQVNIGAPGAAGIGYYPIREYEAGNYKMGGLKNYCPDPKNIIPEKPVTFNEYQDKLFKASIQEANTLQQSLRTSAILEDMETQKQSLSGTPVPGRCV